MPQRKIRRLSLPEIKALASAAGQDKGNRSMRKAGRTVWNREDYNASCKEWARVFKALGGHW